MESARIATDGRVPGAPVAADADEPGLLGNAQALWHELGGLAHDHLQLAALETQRAGRSLVHMLVLAVAAAILLVSAWMGMMGAVVLWLVAGGLAAGSALLFIVVLNLAAAIVLFALIRRSGRHLLFPATVRSLRSDASMFANPEGP